MGTDQKGAVPDEFEGAVRIPENVVFRAFPTETVVLNLDTGQYHGLNPIAGRMLETMEKAASIGEAAQQLAREYGQPAATVEADLRRLCDDLAERGLIDTRADDGA